MKSLKRHVVLLSLIFLLEHSGDIQVFVKRLVTSSVVLKEDKSQNIEYL